MQAAVFHLLLLLTIACQVLCQSRPDQVIWFPIDNYNGYESSLGEIYFDPPEEYQWDGTERKRVLTGGRGGRYDGRRHRSVPSETDGNEFGGEWTGKDEREHSELVKIFGGRGGGERRASLAELWGGKRDADDALVFPGQTNAERMPRAEEECRENCPKTPEYNLVCGSDSQNYHNMAELNCARLCGKSVTFAHYGVCSGGLPLIFKPKPRPVTTPPIRSRYDDYRGHW